MFWRKRREERKAPDHAEWSFKMECYRMAAITALEHCADKLDPMALSEIARLHPAEALEYCVEKLDSATRLYVALKLPVRAVRRYADRLDKETLDLCKRRYAEMQADLEEELRLQLNAIDALYSTKP